MKYAEQSIHELKKKNPKQSEEEKRIQALENKSYFGTVKFHFSS